MLPISQCCSVTGLPVKTDSRWRQMLGPDRRMNFALIGRSILYCAPEGSVTLAEMAAGIAATRRVAGQRLHPARPLVMIYDLNFLKRVTSEAWRHYMRHYNEIASLTALVLCNVSPFMNVGTNLGKRFIATRCPVFMTDNYSQAVALALKICKSHNLEIGPYAFGSAVGYEKSRRMLESVQWCTDAALQWIQPQRPDSAASAGNCAEASEPIHVTDADIRALLAYIGSVNWRERGIGIESLLGEEHPLHPIVQAIRLIKTDLDDQSSERKQVETALKETEAKYRELFERGSDWLCIHDLEGNLLETNCDFKADFGWDVKKPGYPNIRELVPERYRDGVSNYLERIVRKGYDQGILAVTAADGREILLEYHNVLIRDANGEPTLVKGSGRDITRAVETAKEKKRLEKKLQHAQKMESIGILAGGIAHDFNNILSSIIGFAELTLDEGPNSAHFEENLLEIQKAGSRAKDLVKQILAFARQSDEQIRPIQVGIIAKEVLKLIRSTIPSSIFIKQRIHSDSLVMGNTCQLHQIFMNLCTNAAHAMEDKGGVLEVAVTDVDLVAEDVRSQPDLQPGSYLRITVSDNGAGISADVIDSIFDPYFTTKAPGLGTGMGLAIVHGIVKEYDGVIGVVSAPGSGSVFTIHLPVCPHPADADKGRTPPLPSGTERILVVDDEPAIVNLVGRILHSRGYRPTVFTDSQKALDLFKEDPDGFDLVITDLTMPQLTGEVLVERIMSIRPNIPIILWTGYHETVCAEHAAAAGIKALLVKPVTKADLVHTVRKVLDTAGDPVWSKSHPQGSVTRASG